MPVDPTAKDLSESEIYISTDVEADGPIPGMFSMLSLGSAAYLPDKTLVSTFSANLECLPEAGEDPETMKWWDHHRKAYRSTRQNTEPAEQVMQRYLAWLKSFPQRPIFVGYPAGFDFTYVYWYLIRFTGESPFNQSALDIKTFAMSLMGCNYHEAIRRNMPRHWRDPLPHTHHALEDAIEQGALFCNMLAEWKAKKG